MKVPYKLIYSLITVALRPLSGGFFVLLEDLQCQIELDGIYIACVTLGVDQQGQSVGLAGGELTGVLDKDPYSHPTVIRVLEADVGVLVDQRLLQETGGAVADFADADAGGAGQVEIIVHDPEPVLALVNCGALGAGHNLGCGACHLDVDGIAADVDAVYGGFKYKLQLYLVGPGSGVAYTLLQCQPDGGLTLGVVGAKLDALGQARIFRRSGKLRPDTAPCR